MLDFHNIYYNFSCNICLSLFANCKSHFLVDRLVRYLNFHLKSVCSSKEHLHTVTYFHYKSHVCSSREHLHTVTYFHYKSHVMFQQGTLTHSYLLSLQEPRNVPAGNTYTQLLTFTTRATYVPAGNTYTQLLTFTTRATYVPAGNTYTQLHTFTTRAAYVPAGNTYTQLLTFTTRAA